MLDLSFLEEDPYLELKGSESKVSFLEELIEDLKAESIKSGNLASCIMEVKTKSDLCFKQTVAVDTFERGPLLYQANPETISLDGAVATGLTTQFLAVVKRMGLNQFSISSIDGDLAIICLSGGSLVGLITDLRGQFSKVSYMDTVGQPKEIIFNEEVTTENHN